LAHDHHHHHHQDTGNIKVAFFLNLLFTIIELVGGLLTNSLAILSDALHDLGDSLSLGLAWYFQRLSKKGRDTSFSYGYKRFSLLGAIINSIVLIVGSIFIIREAIPRILEPQEANASGMILLAVLGGVVDGAAGICLKRGTSHNESVVALHLMEDVLGWVAVLIGSLVIYFTDWFIIDPILSVLIGLFILFNVYKNLRSSLKIILQAVPSNMEINAIEQELKCVDGVISVHDLHVWSLDGERNVLTVHVVLEGERQAQHHEIKETINAKMAGLGIEHCTIETETEGEECLHKDC